MGNFPTSRKAFPGSPHTFVLSDEAGFQKQRAQAGEARAGGAADWNEGVPVTVGPMEQICVRNVDLQIVVTQPFA